MNNEKYILFLDSGIGGISILKKFIIEVKRVNILYYADTINYPYGNKDEKTIGKILFSIYDNLKKDYSIALIVIVCNTASVSALDYLRVYVNIPIIGTVPAIKPASFVTQNNKIGVIATKTTVKSGYISKLINEYARDKNVYVKAASKLVDAVENNYNENKIDQIIENELKYFKKYDIDVLVLGCTHYSFLKDNIFKYFDNDIHILDSIDGVIKRIIQLMHKKIKNVNSNKILIVSSKDEKIKEKYYNFNKKYNIFNKIIIKDLSCQKV